MNTIKQALAAWVACISLLISSAGVAHASALPDFTALVERQGPAVVNISTTQKVKPRQLSLPGIDENDPMFEFFRRFIPRLPEAPGTDPDDQSLGSGFVISQDGYILTNAHVVADAEEITVRLVDKREFRADVVGTDARSDVAVIKIDATQLPTVVLGSPEALKVGEWVVAIGSPFGFDHSVTAGIVSAKGRSLPDENFVPFIQTDVAINPGNSGGPLFNMRGEVVGINSQIYSQTGGFMGLSFAIPIDVAMDVQQQLRKDGRVKRGRIGVAIQEVTKALSESFGLPRAAGALVSAVEPDGPAAKAGVAQGDVIVRFDGKAVEASADLPRIVSATRPDAEVRLEVYRGGASQTLTIVVGEWQDESSEHVVGKAKPEVAPNRLGLVVSVPTVAQLQALDVQHGLLIERVAGNAARADLRAGDLLSAVVVDGRQVTLTSVQAFDELVRGLAAGQNVTLLVSRAGAFFYVSVKAGD